MLYVLKMEKTIKIILVVGLIFFIINGVIILAYLNLKKSESKSNIAIELLRLPLNLFAWTDDLIDFKEGEKFNCAFYKKVDDSKTTGNNVFNNKLVEENEIYVLCSSTDKLHSFAIFSCEILETNLTKKDREGFGKTYNFTIHEEWITSVFQSQAIVKVMTNRKDETYYAITPRNKNKEYICLRT